MIKPVREVGTYTFDLDGEEAVVKFVATVYPGHRRPGCPGGNCDCCEAFHVEVDLATLKDADTGKTVFLTVDMLAELDANVNADPDRYLVAPWLHP